MPAVTLGHSTNSEQRPLKRSVLSPARRGQFRVRAAQMAEIQARADRPLEEPADQLEARMWKPGTGTGTLARSSSAARPSWPAGSR